MVAVEVSSITIAVTSIKRLQHVRGIAIAAFESVKHGHDLAGAAVDGVQYCHNTCNAMAAVESIQSWAR